MGAVLAGYEARRNEEVLMPTWLIWVIVIVVAVLIVAALVAMAGKRRTAQRGERAQELREEATTHASGLPESHRQAEELRAKADLARAEAERAEDRAADAEQGHRIEQAGYEDKLREADRIDPQVDHRADDYEPDVWNDERSDAGTQSDTTTDRPRQT
jgi:flagellar biosynthesis/type III secretory pathway M-ring protein FliF/YscJ